MLYCRRGLLLSCIFCITEILAFHHVPLPKLSGQVAYMESGRNFYYEVEGGKLCCKAMLRFNFHVFNISLLDDLFRALPNLGPPVVLLPSLTTPKNEAKSINLQVR